MIDIRPPKYPGWEFGKFRQRPEGPGVQKGWIFDKRSAIIGFGDSEMCSILILPVEAWNDIHIHGWELILYPNPTSVKEGYSSHGREPDHEKPLDIEGLEWE